MRMTIFSFLKVMMAAVILASCAVQKSLFKPENLPPDRHWVMVQNVPVVYTDQGQGDPLLILSPYPISTELWKDFAGLLATSKRVIVIEPPGLREPNAMGGDFSSEHLLQIYREFLKTLNIPVVHVLGVGETGGLAVAFGHHFTNRIASVISINGFQAITWSEEAKKTLDLFNEPTEVGLKKLLAIGSIRYRQQPPPREEMDRLLKPLLDQQARKAVNDRITAFLGDIKASYIPTMLPTVNYPLLLVRSENDALLPEIYLMRTRAQIRKGQVKYRVIHQAGHLAFLDQPKELTAVVENFMGAYPIRKATLPSQEADHPMGPLHR